MVAPLSYGAGMKGKITQSLAAGLPVVTTPIGAEGLEVEDGRQLRVGKSGEELAARIVHLAHDFDAWQRLSAKGQEVVQRTCSPSVQRDALRRLLDRAGGRVQ
jgi:O-antigen biosynthesis protein